MSKYFVLLLLLKNSSQFRHIILDAKLTGRLPLKTFHYCCWEFWWYCTCLFLLRYFLENFKILTSWMCFYLITTYLRVSLFLFELLNTHSTLSIYAKLLIIFLLQKSWKSPNIAFPLFLALSFSGTPFRYMYLQASQAIFHIS